MTDASRIRVKIFKVKNILIFCVAMLILLFAWLWFYLQDDQSLPIKRVKILGEYSRIDQAKIKQTISPLVSKSLFSVDLSNVQKKLLTLPWVQDAVVMRVWPDEIDVRLTQKVPLALWNQKGIISDRGQVFYPEPQTIPTNLPHIYAGDSDQDKMLQAYRSFSQILMPLDLHISELRLTSTMSWSLRLNNGMLVNLGHDHMLARLKRFERVYSKIFGDKTAKYVDLRYPHGLAVKWQQ